MGNDPSKPGSKSGSKPGSKSDKAKSSKVKYEQGHLAKRGNEPVNSLFSKILDNYSSIDQVTEALQRTGLESSNLIVALDFTKSNDWTGQNSFGGKCLHQFTETTSGPYEDVIRIIGQTLSTFDEDNLIPCYGFGDATTRDAKVFSFNSGDRPCNGMDEVVERYRDLVPKVRLSGPTSFAPAIYNAMRIVANSDYSYHILLIVADGQVTRPPEMPEEFLSPHEEATIRAIVAASEFPLSIIMVGVGDGPWEVMRSFDDQLPSRRFDNFQFVNYTELSQRFSDNAQKLGAVFALSALMEVPEQYRVIQKQGLLGRRVASHPNLLPLDPPVSAATSPVKQQQAQHGLQQFMSPHPAAFGLGGPQSGSTISDGPFSSTSLGHIEARAGGGSGSNMGPPGASADRTRFPEGHGPPMMYSSTTSAASHYTEAPLLQHANGLSSFSHNFDPPSFSTTSVASSHYTHVPLRQMSGNPLGMPPQLCTSSSAVLRSSYSDHAAHVPPQRQGSELMTQAQPQRLARWHSSISQSTATPDPVFVCPITQEVMHEPVFAADGFTYEGSVIQQWLQSHNTSPMTNQLMGKVLTPNHTLRSAIIAWRQGSGNVH